MSADLCGMKILHLLAVAVFVPLLAACNRSAGFNEDYGSEDLEEKIVMSPREVARIFASLPIGEEQMDEVHNATSGSIGNGYDEEYTMKKLFEAPGCGVGDEESKSVVYPMPLRDLLSEYFSSTKAGSAGNGKKYLDCLSSSDLQIYWPFSENWDGEQYPIVTFDPGDGAETNIGYCIDRDNRGYRIVDSLIVDEAYAKSHPVWVINSNSDSGYVPLLTYDESEPRAAASAYSRRLILHDFTMLRNYDSWLQGGSEFRVLIGAVNGFNASTEAELNLYRPSVTDFMIVVKRSEKGKQKVFDSIVLTDFTNQMENLAFLISEDDGGTRTSWKCSATVKIKSKSYGFDVDLPINEKDDIVWRGQLSASFFQSEDYVKGRFGDVEVTFTLQ